MYRFEEDFLFSLKELQKYIKTETKKGSEQAAGEWTQFESITEKKKKNTSEFKSIRGLVL